MNPKTKHLLVFRLSAMGDVAMTVPVIRAFVNQNPDVKITFVSRPFFKPFFIGIENVSFFEVDVNNRHKGILGLLRLFFDLQKLKFDYVADLHNVLRSKVIRLLFVLTGKRTACTNKGRSEKKALTRAKNKVFKPLKSMFERHVDTFNQLGFDINLANSIVPQKAILSDEIKNTVGFAIDENLIGIAPFAQYKSKVYPVDLMQKVIDELAINTKNKVVLFGGGAEEIAVLNQLAKNKEKTIVIAGKLNLEQELQLISNLNVMLSMDSGNAHLAAMLGIKVITLWGATHPFAGFLPFNQPLNSALVADREKFPLVPTSVYGNKSVEGYHDVMRTILPEKVVEKINGLLYG